MHCPAPGGGRAGPLAGPRAAARLPVPAERCGLPSRPLFSPGAQLAALVARQAGQATRRCRSGTCSASSSCWPANSQRSVQRADWSQTRMPRVLIGRRQPAEAHAEEKETITA